MFSPLLIIFIVIFIIILINYLYNIKIFNNKKIIINTNKINSSFSFLYLTDLHEKEFGKNNCRLIDFINNNDINDILIGGDFITFTKRANINNDYYINTTKHFLCNLSKNKNVYYAYGNHELRLKYKQFDDFKLKQGYDDFYNTLLDNNVNILDNTNKNLDSNIILYGYSLNNKYYEKRKFKSYNYYKEIIEDLNNNFGKLDINKYNICLLHNPDFAEIIIDYGFDMVICGHHHGGLIRFPFIGSIISPDFEFLPKYTKGLYNYKNKPIIVSGGLGEHTLKIRLNNTCELYTIILENKYGTDSI